MPGLVLGDNSKINVAEFLAALITCESFATHCSGKFSTLSLDNFSAKSWFDSARCPSYPSDRCGCAKGVHPYLLDQSVKIKTAWVSSAENRLADTVSRKPFNMKSSPPFISGTSLRKVRPKWSNVLRFF